MTEELEQYITDHLGDEPDYLRECWLETWRYRLYPRMCSGPVQGSLLSMLATMVQPRRVLEIGTYSGYSAMAIASGMPEGGELHTIEIDDEHEEFIRRQLSRFPVEGRIHLHIGDAMDVVPALGDELWDMVFIDANKRNYPDYYELIFPRVRIGGYIIVDNTLWDGKVIVPDAINDPQCRGIMEFNDIVAHDPRVTRAILPVRDGLTILRKTKH